MGLILRVSTRLTLASQMVSLPATQSADRVGRHVSRVLSAVRAPRALVQDTARDIVRTVGFVRCHPVLAVPGLLPSLSAWPSDVGPTSLGVFWPVRGCSPCLWGLMAFARFTRRPSPQEVFAGSHELSLPLTKDPPHLTGLLGL